MATKNLLTEEKQKWVKKFKPTAAIKGKPLQYSASVQAKYASDVRKLMNAVIAETEKEIRKIYKTPEAEKFFSEDASIAIFAIDASVASVARKKLDALQKRMDKKIDSNVQSIVDRMMRGVDKSSKSNLNSSLKELSGGLSIKTDISTGRVKDAFQASINANTDLIKTISSNYIQQVSGAVDRSIQGGGGIGALESTIDKFLSAEAKKTKNKAKNVALDQTRKAYNALNAARMEKIGVDKYEWVHSNAGQVPRKHHITRFPSGLNGGIFSLQDPPIIDPKTGERGIPGQAINCKCVMRPVIEFDEGKEVD